MARTVEKNTTPELQATKTEIVSAPEVNAPKTSNIYLNVSIGIVAGSLISYLLFGFSKKALLIGGAIGGTSLFGLSKIK